MLKICKQLTPYNFSDRLPGGRRIEYIVIHYFGSLGSAKAVANYFANAYRGASAHYTLDEGSTVYQCVEDEDIAWHCGTDWQYFHPNCRNSNSIGIEVRPCKLDHATAGDAYARDWYFTPEVMDNLVELTRRLMAKYNIHPENVLRHYDVTHKMCPRPLVGDDVNTYYGTTGNAQWEKFKARLMGEEDEDMDVERFKELWHEMRKELQDNESSHWSQEARDWAISTGLVHGGSTGELNAMWEDVLTREQLVTILYRFAQQMGKA